MWDLPVSFNFVGRFSTRKIPINVTEQSGEKKAFFPKKKKKETKKRKTSMTFRFAWRSCIDCFLIFSCVCQFSGAVILFRLWQKISIFHVQKIGFFLWHINQCLCVCVFTILCSYKKRIFHLFHVGCAFFDIPLY